MGRCARAQMPALLVSDRLGSSPRHAGLHGLPVVFPTALPPPGANSEIHGVFLSSRVSLLGT